MLFSIVFILQDGLPATYSITTPTKEAAVRYLDARGYEKMSPRLWERGDGDKTVRACIVPLYEPYMPDPSFISPAILPKED